MLDFSKIFQKYEILVAGIDQTVKQIWNVHSDCIRCGKHCSDCCSAVFDLSLIESVYINRHFFLTLDRERQDLILERADKSDRAYYKLKRKLHTMVIQQGEAEEKVLNLLARERIRCPFLNKEDLCDFYDYRPITCRVYGVPTAIRGTGHTCGQSGFEEGKSYPTINLDRINDRLLGLSNELLKEIGRADQELMNRFIPVSTSLLTDYDEEFFGLTPCTFEESK